MTSTTAAQMTLTVSAEASAAMGTPAAAMVSTVAAPLRAVDRMRVSGDLHDGLTVWAAKTVTATDPYLVGHFPGLTVYPGIFTLESVCQVVAAALRTRTSRAAEMDLLRSARFVSPLLDGDELLVEAHIGPAGLLARLPSGLVARLPAKRPYEREDLRPSELEEGFDVVARCLRAPDVPAARIRAHFRWCHADDS